MSYSLLVLRYHALGGEQLLISARLPTLWIGLAVDRWLGVS